MSFWTDNTLNSECSSCGRCCANILILQPSEIQKIKKYVKENNIKLINRNSIFSQESSDVCPFLSKENKCLIYSVRPQICRNFICNGKETQFTMEEYQYAKVVNMLLEFGEKGVFCPNSPNLKELQKDIEDNYKQLRRNKNG